MSYVCASVYISTYTHPATMSETIVLLCCHVLPLNQQEHVGAGLIDSHCKIGTGKYYSTYIYLPTVVLLYAYLSLSMPIYAYFCLSLLIIYFYNLPQLLSYFCALPGTPLGSGGKVTKCSGLDVEWNAPQTMTEGTLTNPGAVRACPPVGWSLSLDLFVDGFILVHLLCVCSHCLTYRKAFGRASCSG